MSLDLDGLFAPETFVLGDERDRLDDRLDELADEFVEMGENNPLRPRHAAEADEVENHLDALDWACEALGAEEEVVVRGLSAGEHARVVDWVDEHMRGGGPGSRQNVLVAAGLVDAPFLDVESDGDAESDDAGPSIEDALPAVASLPPGFRDWLQSCVDDLTTVSEGNSQSFDERIRARRGE